MAKIKYYAVKIGKTPGIYMNWDDCKAQVEHYPGAQYKSFGTPNEAEKYISGDISAKTEQNDLEKIEGVVAYVDGSVGGETGSDYAYGVVILEGEKEVHLSGRGNHPDMIPMRNVAGEIMGSMQAMRYAKDKGIKEITIVHDYNGIAEWCVGGWKTNNICTQKYKEFYEKMSKCVKINFQKVKGHSNCFYNDVVDALAKQALGIDSGIKKAVKEHIQNIANED